MKLCLKILAIVIVAATVYSLIGCAAPAHFSYSNVTLSLSYTPCYDNCPPLTYNPANTDALVTSGPGASGCDNVFATVTNAPANITYTLYPTPSLIIPKPSGLTQQASPVGNINFGDGTTTFYCAPGTLPVYTGAALEQAQAMGIPQGDVELVAGVPNNPNTPSSSCVLPTSPGCTTFVQLFQIYNQGSPTGPPTVELFPSTPSGYVTSAVTLNTRPPSASCPACQNQFQFNGFAIGAPPCLTSTACLINGTAYPLYSTDNKVLWLVGQGGTSGTAGTAVLGGNTTYGTITSTGLYTAPAAVPTGSPYPQVLVVAEAEIVPTQTVTAYVTIVP
jgi:hypothetical protein